MISKRNVTAIDYLGLEADLREMERQANQYRLALHRDNGTHLDQYLCIAAFRSHCALFADEIASRRDQG